MESLLEGVIIEVEGLSFLVKQRPDQSGTVDFTEINRPETRGFSVRFSDGDRITKTRIRALISEYLS